MNDISLVDGGPGPATAAADEQEDGRYANGITVKIADLGNACWVDHHFTNDIQTRQYRTLTCGAWRPWWVPGDGYWGKEGRGRGENIYGQGEEEEITELLGNIPKHLALSGKYSSEIFNRKGELRHIHKLRFWRLQDVLHDKYLLGRREADFLSSFLLPMLDLHPDRRASAREMVIHPWLAGVEPILDGEVIPAPDADDRIWEEWERDREVRKERERQEERKTEDQMRAATKRMSSMAAAYGDGGDLRR
ncbi:hypothetical protein BC936DRAFT_140574 [Jimgerdemannia flammicorona]|uniref:non-specific serine/threonine protein kinase n=1 Tax=Jimgerdemannia flammicorona TaxID=994334 RepID=A0A433AM04_9FUNG|nr:hypothetical protein BC936DRAFT_140574 [Jimgerdemannia flammicorona]